MRIAVVGAGPAGSYLAWRLADTEHEIQLFDPRAPWEKPCGGGLSALVGRQFPEVMDLPFPRHRPASVQVCASDRSRAEYPLGAEGWAIVSRTDLGQALLAQALAGAWVRHVCQRVVDVAQTGDEWSLRTDRGEIWSADFLAGAGGVQSLVRRQAVGPIPRQHLGQAVGYWVEGGPDAVIFQTYADLTGYLWSFPRVDHASVGIGAFLGSVPARELWHRVDRFLDESCPGAVKLGRYAALLPMAHDPSLWDTPCAGPGWALLGDAAGHVHPLTGEGIAYALWSADLLADALVQGEPMAYEQMWGEEYGCGFVASGEMLSTMGDTKGAYEIAFQLAMALALPGSG